MRRSIQKDVLERVFSLSPLKLSSSLCFVTATKMDSLTAFVYPILFFVSKKATISS
uniref:Uncharacterized protein n=1 Tax=Utricularia reniformis TaxID=192314 RepID=A0A1Y0B0E2_9LAMI|nr:hypothetical protein AEK19_MT0622 [Utricularia reniformis]ART30877.1 hypothetical protein AEK19_MT0622 [Utricularia reniformis]